MFSALVTMGGIYFSSSYFYSSYHIPNGDFNDAAINSCCRPHLELSESEFSSCSCPLHPQTLHADKTSMVSSCWNLTLIHSESVSSDNDKRMRYKRQRRTTVKADSRTYRVDIAVPLTYRCTRYGTRARNM